MLDIEIIKSIFLVVFVLFMIISVIIYRYDLKEFTKKFF